VAQQRAARHVLRRPDDHLGLRRARRDQRHVLPREVVRAGAGPVAVAEKNGAVELGPLEVVAVHEGHEMQRDLRVQPLKVGQPRNQPLGAEGGQRRQVQRAAAVAAGNELQRGRLQLREQGANRLLVALSGRRERQALAAALEQRRADPALEFLHLLAHRALREVQRLGRARHTAEAHHRGKGAQQVQRGIESAQ
jgi:hypothetical protein